MTRIQALYPTLVAVAVGVATISCGTRSTRGTSQRPAAGFRPLAGTYGSSWGTPMTFQQQGDRAVARFDRNGWLDCRWNAAPAYLCSWRNDQGQGFARIWFDGDRPAGQYGLGNSADNAGRIEFWFQQPSGAYQPGSPPATASVPPTQSDGGGCSSVVTPPSDGPVPCTGNSTCPDDMRCINAYCASSLGTKCGIASDCSRIGNKYECKTSGPWKMDGVCTAK